MNQNDIPNYQYYLGCNAKKNGSPNFPRQKVCFSIGIIDLFAYSIFKIEILSDQGVAQSEPK